MSEEVVVNQPEQGAQPAEQSVIGAQSPVVEKQAEAAPSDQKSTEQATEAAPDGEKKEELTPEQAAKREGRRFGRRLDAANRRAAEERARADFLESKLKEVSQSTQPSKIAGAPKFENFTSVEEYEAAAAKFHREQAIREHTRAQQAAAINAAQSRLQSEWEQKAERGASKYDDFDRLVGELKPVNAVAAAIMEAENAEDVAYHLMKHPEEMRRIMEMPNDISKVRAIGKLEAKLLVEPAKPKPASKAPAPITPVGGKSNGTSDIPLDTDDIKTWMKKENARMAKLSAMQ